jgi:hypothetical protein
LLRRLRARRAAWFFTREAVAAGGEVLRRGGEGADLEAFLGRIVRDPAGSYFRARGPEGYAGGVRDAALLEAAVEMVAAGRMRDALDALRGEVLGEAFARSALVHAYIGVLCVSLAAEEDDPTALLSAASAALEAASKLDPAAHCFVHYAAAAAVAAGDTDAAASLQRKFAAAHPDDPTALAGLLSALGLAARRDAGARAERVAVARALLRVDPMARDALAVLREALAWAWDVSPAVDLPEVADAVAGRIECGAGDAAAWAGLLELLRSATDADVARFMFDSGRSAWWSSHFFRPARAAADAAASAACATAKMGVAQLIFGDSAYVRAVAAVTNCPPPAVTRAASGGGGGARSAKAARAVAADAGDADGMDCNA